MLWYRQIVRWKGRRGLVGLRTVLLAVLLVVCLGLFSSTTGAQQAKPSEYKVKAIYLYNFGKFVEWPEAREPREQPDRFLICVLGKDPFGSLLDSTIKGEDVNGMNLSAKRVSNAADATGCRILFISSSEADRVVTILQELHSKPILTVSDIANFCDRGGMIQFELKEEKVRFAVNMTAAEKAGLTLSSQLVKVATSVRRNP
jgi:hypothetical protein